MMIALEIPAETRAKIDRDAGLANRFREVVAEGLSQAIATGAERVMEQMRKGELGLQPGSNTLADSVTSKMLDRAVPVGAIGVFADSPAATYAGIHERGGVITPRNARALAVPVSPEARKFTSPRDMPNLTLIPRKGKPALLVEKLSSRGSRQEQWRIHWVLLASVTIEATHWLSRGVEAARADMVGVVVEKLDGFIGTW